MSLVTVPDVFANGNSAQFPSRPYARRNKKLSTVLRTFSDVQYKQVIACLIRDILTLSRILLT